MKFAAVIDYLTDAEKIQAIRPQHREYLADLKAKGKLFVSGPFTDGSGALIIYEAESEAEARELLENDPFCQGGVFVRWQVRPWQQVF